MAEINVLFGRKNVVGLFILILIWIFLCCCSGEAFLGNSHLDPLPIFFHFSSSSRIPVSSPKHPFIECSLSCSWSRQFLVRKQYPVMKDKLTALTWFNHTWEKSTTCFQRQLETWKRCVRFGVDSWTVFGDTYPFVLVTKEERSSIKQLRIPSTPYMPFVAQKLFKGVCINSIISQENKYFVLSTYASHFTPHFLPPLLIRKQWPTRLGWFIGMHRVLEQCSLFPKDFSRTLWQLLHSTRASRFQS